MEALLPLLIKLFGPTLARVIFAVALKDRIQSEAIGSGDIAETLADSLDIASIVDRLTNGDRRAQRNANYIFETIGDEVAEKLVEVFRIENGQISDATRDTVLAAAKQTMQERALPLLIECNFDSGRFPRLLREQPSPMPLHEEVEQQLYQRLLFDAAGYIFAVAEKLPHFTRDTTAQILQNAEHQLQLMKEALSYQERILQQSYGSHKERSVQLFESDYRRLLASELDKLRLFGVPTLTGYHQPLSVAFVKMRLSSSQDEYSIAVRYPVTGSVHKRVQRHLFWWDKFTKDEVISAEQVLTSGNRLLITARAGLGKTTLMRWGAVQAARNAPDPELALWRDKIPFFIQTRDFVKDNLPSIADLPLAAPGMKILANNVPTGWAGDHLRNQKGILFIDGLDEVGEVRQRDILAWIEDILGLYPETICIVSTRPSALRSEFAQRWFEAQGFQCADLLPLNDEQIESFIQHWHTAILDDKCLYPAKTEVPAKQEQLRKIVMERPQLLALSRTPLLCSMICALHLTELGKLPQDRIQLYNRCIEMLLNRDEQRGVDLSDHNLNLRPNSARRFLARLALWMMETEVSAIRGEDAERILANDGADGAELLRFLADRTGILQQIGHDEYEFVHRTFFEFLAAQQVVRNNDVVRIIRSYALNAEWQETICLIAGYAEPTDQERLLGELWRITDKETTNDTNHLHLLAWYFWDLLDVPTQKALDCIQQHTKALVHEESGTLDLLRKPISDLKPLAVHTDLLSLELSHTQVSDLSPLSKLTNLQKLRLVNTSVVNLKPLKCLVNLQELILSGTLVHDLKPIGGLCNLKSLFLHATPVSDIKTVALFNTFAN